MRHALLLAALAGPIARAADPARLDAVGDPLPPGCVARFGTDRMRTTSHPSGGTLVWSADGKRLAVAQPLHAVRVWDGDTGRLVRHFDGPFDYCSAAFAPDGKSLLLAERRGLVWRLDLAAGRAALLYDARHGRPRPKGPYFESPPLSQMSPDGKEFYVSGKDGNWEARDAEVPAEVAARVPTPAGGLWLAPRSGHKYWVFCDGKAVTRVERATGAATPVRVGDGANPTRLLPMAVSPDGRVLVLMVGYEGTALYDLHDGKVAHQRRGTAEAVFAPDGKQLLWSSGGKNLFTTLEVATGKESPAVPGEARAWLYRPAVSPDGRVVAVTDGYQVRVFGTADGKERFPELGAGHSTVARHVFPAAVGKAISADLRTAQVWDAGTGKAVGPVPFTGVLHDLHLSADGAWAGFPRGGGGVELVDTATGKTRVTVTGPQGANRAGQFLGFSDVGNLWFSTTTPGAPGTGTTTVHEVDPKTQAEVQANLVVRAYQNFRPTVSGDGRVVVAPSLRDVSVWRAGAGTVTRPAPVALGRPGFIRDFDRQGLSADGRVYAANRENYEAVEVWLTDPVVRAGRAAVADPPPETAVAGGLAAAVDAVRQSRISSDDPLLPEPGRTRPARLSALAVSPDGRLVAVGRSDGVVVGLEAVSLGERFRAKVSAGSVAALGFTPDGARLLVGGHDTVASVWDLAALLPPVPAPAADLWAGLADPDPRRAAAAVRGLAANGPAAVALLKGKGPVRVDLPVARLVAALSDPDYQVREKAEGDLARLGPAAIPELQAEAAKSDSEEARRRIESAVRRIRTSPFGPAGLTADQVRAVRMVEVLERVGSGEARAVLGGWAKDHPGTLLGAEAKAAGDRLARRK